MDYYTIVTIVAIVLLVVLLTVIGIMMTSKKNKKGFPDYKNVCPDYWTFREGSDTICMPPAGNINVPKASAYEGMVQTVIHDGVNLDSSKKRVTSIDISKENWTSDCDKKKWATKNGILWDGITNSNLC